MMFIISGNKWGKGEADHEFHAITYIRNYSVITNNFMRMSWTEMTVCFFLPLSICPSNTHNKNKLKYIKIIVDVPTFWPSKENQTKGVIFSVFHT